MSPTRRKTDKPKRKPALETAAKRALNWLASYPGGGAEGAYNDLRTALGPRWDEGDFPSPPRRKEYRWRTADGRELLVSEMADEHLANAIAFLWDRIRASMESSRIEQHAIALQHMEREQKRRLYESREHAHPLGALNAKAAIILFTREEVLALVDHATFAYQISAREVNAFNTAMTKLERKAAELRRT